MQITLDIPEEFAAQIIPHGKDPARVTLEALGRVAHTLGAPFIAASPR